MGWILTVGQEPPNDNVTEADLRNAARALNYEDVLEVSLAKESRTMRVQARFGEELTVFDFEVEIDGDAKISRDIEGTNTVFALLQSFYQEDGRWWAMTDWKKGKLGKADGGGSQIPRLVGLAVGIGAAQPITHAIGGEGNIAVAGIVGGICGALGALLGMLIGALFSKR